MILAGRTYDLGGQVLAANSAPVIFHLAKEIGAETEEMDFHKFAIIDSSTGKYEDTKVVDDYLSVISLTLKLQVNFSFKTTLPFEIGIPSSSFGMFVPGEVKNEKEGMTENIACHCELNVVITCQVNQNFPKGIKITGHRTIILALLIHLTYTFQFNITYANRMRPRLLALLESML